MNSFEQAAIDKQMVELMELRNKLLKEAMSFPPKDYNFLRDLYLELNNRVEGKEPKLLLIDRVKQGKADKKEIQAVKKMIKGIKDFDYKLSVFNNITIIGMTISAVKKGADFNEFTEFIRNAQNLNKNDFKKELNFATRNVDKSAYKKGIVN